MTAPSPFANILHRDAIRALVDARTFERGQDYFVRRKVASMMRQDATLVATVRGTSDYRVRLWVKDDALAYSCTCPIGTDRLFCKHGVAVALAWLAQDGKPITVPPSAALLPAELRTRLLGLEKEALVALLLERAASDPILREALLRLVPLA